MAKITLTPYELGLGLNAMYKSALGIQEHPPQKKGRKKGSVSHKNDKKAIDWIILQIQNSDLSNAVHIRDGIEKFSLQGASPEAIYDRIRRKTAKSIKQLHLIRHE